MGLLVERFNEYKSNKGRLFMKHPRYAPIYEHWFEPYQNRPITLLEFGIGKGGCLQVWREYFGKEAKIYGSDFMDTLAYDDPEINGFFIGKQNDAELHQRIKKELPRLDIIIDDASHVNSDMIATFEAMFPHLSPGGLYIIEDTHTSYRPKDYGGGYKKPGTFIEYCKDIIDNQYHREDANIPKNPVYTDKIFSVSFYLTIIIIKKEGRLCFV